MADLKQIVSRKAENDTKWREQQQAERENTVAMQDAGITEITTTPEAYARYLEMQGDNPTYSAGNIALVMFGQPQATIFATRDRWKTLNRSVMEAEKGKGTKIFARSPMGRGYTLADAYDISQTQGREIKQTVLRDDTKDMETALSTVLNYAVVPVVIDEELPVAAFYDQRNMELAVNPTFPDSEAFAAIAAEVAHSRLHAKGAFPGYDRDECDLDAQSVSYILCRRFGREKRIFPCWLRLFCRSLARIKRCPVKCSEFSEDTTGPEIFVNCTTASNTCISFPTIPLKRKIFRNTSVFAAARRQDRCTISCRTGRGRFSVQSTTLVWKKGPPEEKVCIYSLRLREILSANRKFASY